MALDGFYSTPLAQLRVNGLDQAVANLELLGRRKIFAVTRRAVRAGLKPAVEMMREMSPETYSRSGALKKSIRVTSTDVDRSTGWVTGSVSFRSTKAQRKKGQSAYYAHMVVGGTRRHYVGNGRGGQYLHPGARANPFPARAGRASARAQQRAFSVKLRDEIEKEIAKLGVG